MEEEKYLNQLEQQLIDNGWKTEREIIPDQCETWEMPWRVDLIIYKPETGLIGIEAKQCNNKTGKILAKAYKQIKKYSNCTFFKGRKIIKWAIVMFGNNPILYHSQVIIQAFLNELGIGWVNLGSVKRIEFAGTLPSARVQLTYNPYQKTVMNPEMDCEKIEKIILRKKGEIYNERNTKTITKRRE